jgi:hypothetical protein
MKSHLWEDPISAEREIDKAGNFEPCLILGTIDSENPGDYPYFLIVKIDGTLGTTELDYLRTNWRYEDGRWVDTKPLVIFGDTKQAEPPDEGETGDL